MYWNSGLRAWRSWLFSIPPLTLLNVRPGGVAGRGGEGGEGMMERQQWGAICRSEKVAEGKKCWFTGARNIYRGKLARPTGAPLPRRCHMPGAVNRWLNSFTHVGNWILLEIFRGESWCSGLHDSNDIANPNTFGPKDNRQSNSKQVDIGCEKGRRKGQVIVLGSCSIEGPTSGIVVLGPTFGDCEFSVFNVLLRGQAMLKPACPGCLLPLGLLALWTVNSEHSEF